MPFNLGAFTGGGDGGGGGGSGDVTAASNIADNALVRGDGGAKGVQSSGVSLSDVGAMAFGGTGSILGVTTVGVDSNNYVDFDASGLIRIRANAATEAFRASGFSLRCLDVDPLAATNHDFGSPSLPWRHSTHQGYHEMLEISDPSAPAANTGRLYVRDNGAGKSQLCIRFNTGAIQVIATEP